MKIIFQQETINKIAEVTSHQKMMVDFKMSVTGCQERSVPIADWLVAVVKLELLVDN